MRFTRTTTVPTFTNYQRYRPFLRVDFKKHCAYCTSHESEAGGDDHFEIDHHQPTSKGGSRTDYLNLYYSCRGCNKRGAKGDQWPSAALRGAGYRFIDSVAENPYVNHLRVEMSGRVSPMTHVGEYSEKKLRLNRVFLIDLRQARRRNKLRLNGELRKLISEMARYREAGGPISAISIGRIRRIRATLHQGPILSCLPIWF